MYHLTREEIHRANTPEAMSTGSRLIRLFQNMNFSRTEKMKAAYQIVRDDNPQLDTVCYLIHARILIDAAQKAANETIIFARTETPQTVIETLYKEFPNATEITA